MRRVSIHRPAAWRIAVSVILVVSLLAALYGTGSTPGLPGPPTEIRLTPDQLQDFWI
jgi:hypothetical protein